MFDILWPFGHVRWFMVKTKRILTSFRFEKAKLIRFFVQIGLQVANDLLL